VGVDFVEFINWLGFEVVVFKFLCEMGGEIVRIEEVVVVVILDFADLYFFAMFKHVYMYCYLFY
jgi:hypothetical protein